MPAQAQVVRIAKEMFEIADENGDEDISVEEFLQLAATVNASGAVFPGNVKKAMEVGLCVTPEGP